MSDPILHEQEGRQEYEKFKRISETPEEIELRKRKEAREREGERPVDFNRLNLGETEDSEQQRLEEASLLSEADRARLAHYEGKSQEKQKKKIVKAKQERYKVEQKRKEAFIEGNRELQEKRDEAVKAMVRDWIKVLMVVSNSGDVLAEKITPIVEKFEDINSMFSLELMTSAPSQEVQEDEEHSQEAEGQEGNAETVQNPQIETLKASISEANNELESFIRSPEMESISSVQNKDSLRRIGENFKKIASKIGSEIDVAVRGKEKLTFCNVFQRALGETDSEGFRPDFAAAGLESRGDELEKRKRHALRYKTYRSVEYTDENLKTLIEDALGKNDELVDKLMKKNQNGETEIINEFVNKAYLSYQMFRNLKSVKDYKTANDYFLDVVEFFTEKVPELKTMMSPGDDRLYYLVVNFGENIAKGTVRLHADILGKNEEETDAHNVDAAKTITGKDLYASKSARELNVGASIGSRYYSIDEILKIFERYYGLVGYTISDTCVEDLMSIKAMDMIYGYEREAKDFRFRIKSSVTEQGGKYRRLFVDSVIAINDSVKRVKTQKAKPEEEQQSQQPEGQQAEGQQAEGQQQKSEADKNAPMKLDQLSVTEALKSSIGGLTRKGIFDMTLGKASASAKADVEPVFARFMLYRMSIITDKATFDEFATQEDLALIQQYYPKAVKKSAEGDKLELNIEMPKLTQPAQPATSSASGTQQQPTTQQQPSTQEQPIREPVSVKSLAEGMKEGYVKLIREALYTGAGRAIRNRKTHYRETKEWKLGEDDPMSVDAAREKTSLQTAAPNPAPQE